MITITLKGMDIYQAITETGKIHSKIASIYGIRDEELDFFAVEGFIIHAGVEQTCFRLNIDVEAPEGYEGFENEVKDALVKGLKDVAIHFHIIFHYFNPENEYLITDDSYPLYMNESNTVKAVMSDEEREEMENSPEDLENGQEPYMGDILGLFDNYVKDHPNASNKEIYEALAGIRKKVAEDHASEDEDNIEEELEEEEEEDEDEDAIARNGDEDAEESEEEGEN